MGAHSKIGASSMYRWEACPGSVRLSEGIPSKSSVYAEEGTLAHDICADILLGNGPKRPVDDEMAEAVMVYVDAVNATTGSDRLIEHRFDLSSIYPGLFGTCDAIVYDADQKLLTVFDYKHGAGIPVEVVEDGKPNTQLLYYGLGALVTCGFLVEDIELCIVQPRCNHPDGPIRRHRFKSFELLDFAADLVDAARRTEDPNAPLNPGDHCRFCPAAGICPELQKKSLEAAKDHFSDVTTYDPEKLSQTLAMLPAVEAWVKAVREFAYAEAQHGRTPPGWKLVAKRATRKWKSEPQVLEELEKYPWISKDEIVETSIRSVAQIEKVMGKKEFAQALGDLVTSESSGTTLAPETDKRPAVSLSAAQVFIEADFNEIS